MLVTMKNEQLLSPKFKMYPTIHANIYDSGSKCYCSGCTDTGPRGYRTHFMIQLLKTKNHHFNPTGWLTVCNHRLQFDHHESEC